MSAINKVSCRLYLDGEYTPFYDEDGNMNYCPSSHDQDALGSALFDLLYDSKIKGLGEIETECMYYDSEEGDEEIRDIVITHAREEVPFPQAWLTKFMNKSFQIHPPQWGQDPWGVVYVEIVPFNSPAPKKFLESASKDSLKKYKDELAMLEARVKTLKKSIAELESQSKENTIRVSAPGAPVTAN